MELMNYVLIIRPAMNVDLRLSPVAAEGRSFQLRRACQRVYHVRPAGLEQPGRTDLLWFEKDVAPPDATLVVLLL